MRFLSLQPEPDLSLRDYVMICNAFKTAKKEIDDAVFVRLTNEKLAKDEQCAEFDW